MKVVLFLAVGVDEFGGRKEQLHDEHACATEVGIFRISMLRLSLYRPYNARVLLKTSKQASERASNKEATAVCTALAWELRPVVFVYC